MPAEQVEYPCAEMSPIPKASKVAPGSVSRMAMRPPALAVVPLAEIDPLPLNEPSVKFRVPALPWGPPHAAFHPSDWAMPSSVNSPVTVRLIAAPARILKAFIKKAKKCEFKGGIVEKNILNAAQIEAIADLPSREVMIARMLGSMMSPISKFVIALNEIAKKQGGAEA